MQDNKFTLDPESPTIVAIANNTAANHTTVPTRAFSEANSELSPKSTLAGIVRLATAKWISLVAFTGEGMKITENLPAEEYQVPSRKLCTQWSTFACNPSLRL